MDSGTITIRIHGTDGGPVVDWGVQPNTVRFDETLMLMSRMVPGQTINAFEYEDEDGDRITVRSDEELMNMVSSYLSSVEEMSGNGSMSKPLFIYPRVGRTPGKRNIDGLKVLTGSSCGSGPGTPEVSPMEQVHPNSGSKKQGSRDIREILAAGGMQNEDLDISGMEILGSGNAGMVYKAYHKATGIITAVKVIPLDISPETQSQIISELEILYRCKSSVIIAFYGAFFLENRISICTEYMDGGSLKKYGPIEEPVLGRISLAVVSGLDYLWTERIMHRDVKPSNILVNTKGYVKLCDFSVSVQLVNSIAKTYIGTNIYMAPERISGSEYSIQADVWSLGVTIFELAVGHFPYDDINVMDAKVIDLMKFVVGLKPPTLPRGKFSDACIDFVAHCMQKDPMRRPAPSHLLQHPFLRSYDDGNVQIVAKWLKEQLEALKYLEQLHKSRSA